MLRVQWLLVVGLLTISACSSLPSWWGDEEEPLVEGERISVLKSKASVSPDYALDSVNVTLPSERENKRWYKSSGFHVLLPENPSLLDVSSKQTAKIGKGGEEGARLTASPIVAENMLFAIDGWGRVSAFEATNLKKLLWRTDSLSKKNKYRTGQSGITYHRQLLYVTTGSNEIVALDIKDGNEVWRRSINSITRSAPAVNGGRVFVNTIDNRLYALSAEDGSILWTHIGIGEEISIFGSAPPVSVSDMVFVPYSSGELYALKVTDGREVWSDNLASDHSNTAAMFVDIEASPVINFDKVIATSSGGMFTSIEFFSGAPVWEKEIPTTKTPWVSGDFIYFVSNEQQLICMHVASGRVKWIKDLPSYKKPKNKKGPIFWTAPVVAGGKIFVVNSLGKMLAVSPSTGEVEKEYKVLKEVYIAPIVAHNRLYLLNDQGVLAAYFSKKQ